MQRFGDTFDEILALRSLRKMKIANLSNPMPCHTLRRVQASASEFLRWSFATGDPERSATKSTSKTYRTFPEKPLTIWHQSVAIRENWINE